MAESSPEVDDNFVIYNQIDATEVKINPTYNEIEDAPLSSGITTISQSPPHSRTNSSAETASTIIGNGKESHDGNNDDEILIRKELKLDDNIIDANNEN